MKIAHRFILVILLIGLSFYAVVGSNTLMMADDYCYFALPKNQSFINAFFNTYFHAIVIAGNRFSATLLSMIFSLGGDISIRVFPFLTIIGLLVSIFYLFNQLLSLFIKKIDMNIIGIISGFLIGILLYISPSKFQNIYWFSGNVAYTVPIIFYSVLISSYIKTLKSKHDYWIYLLVFVFTIITVGFSETSAVAFFVHFSLTFTVLYVSKTIKFDSFNKLMPFVGFLVGLILLIISPSAHSRNNGVDITHIGLIKLFINSFQFGLNFIIDQINSYTIPIFVLFATMLILGVLLDGGVCLVNNKNYGIASIFLITSTFLVISSSMAPQLFAFGSYPNTRSQLIPLFFLLFGLSLFSLLTGMFLKRNFNKMRYILIIPLILATIYMVRAGFLESTYSSELKSRAILWQERNEIIHQKIEIGEKDIKIFGIDSIETIMDFNPVCFRDYYQLENIEILE